MNWSCNSNADCGYVDGVYIHLITYIMVIG